MITLISADNIWALWAVLTAIAAISIWLEQKYKWAGKVTGCVLALIFAMILSNLRVIPVDAPTYDNVWSYVVPLAIPMLLFNANVKKIWRESGRLLVIYLLSGLGTIAGAFIASSLLKNVIPEIYKPAAMMTGTYTGGSVNLVAMADAFGATGDIVTASVVADNLLMALYFFVLIAIPTMNFFLKKYPHPIIDQIEKEGVSEEGKTRAAQFWSPKNVSLLNIASIIAISFVIVAVSSAIADFFSKVIPTGNLGLDLLNGLLGNKYMIITTITMLLATKFSGFFGKIGGAQEIGTFLIHIFFAVIGVPASISLIVTKSPILLVFCAIIVFTNLVVTLLFGKLLKFNLEEMMLAANANVGGPTTSAAMAIAKGWDKLIIPTILCGTLGYVIGNYYGVLVGNIIKGW
ncbi:DUF819 family protein [Proteiniborus sp. MB09-C3]|uniref:DUF819 family protein n=1 Tax=Proteiniborus sp. MB09-C3 TaxID=3050072 RepID=UPI0025556253|nr:DUF819 family protein [Proteiniborus sp. MB09-C3]WIV13057.1 DUF819 family protein [Proteiniborus sp. MB09-C3]